MRRQATRVLGLLLTAGVAHASPSADPPRETVEERTQVVESAVIVRPPAVRFGSLPHTSYSYGTTPSGQGAGVDVPLQRSTKVRELVVYLGETPLEVTGVERVGREQEWTVVIYLDAPLTSSETLFRSAVALAKAAERLTALGAVELLIADPRARVEVPPTRFPQAIESALADVAMRASREEIGGELAALWRRSVMRRDRSAESAAEHDRAVHRLVTRQVRELSQAARDRCRTDACLMLLVSEGFSETPSRSTESAGESGASAACCAEASRRLARELAASRWLTGVVVVQQERDLGDIPARERPPEARQLDAGIPPENYDRNAATVPSTKSQSISLEKLDLVVRLESEPLKRVARATGGFLAATPGELHASLRELEKRILVWFRPPEEPPTDTLPLRVVFAPRDQELWAPRWWRARDEAQ